MDSDSSLINIGELSKPATVLIEKISHAIGGYAKPWHMLRVARAEAEVDKIRATTQIEITEIHRRAMHRFLEEEANKQRNIESITEKSLPYLEDESKPQNIDDDWIVNFFDKSRLISDDEMQNLWAKILAGEANEPGKYSKRTVNSLASLDKSDAILFATLCGYGWFLGRVYAFVYDADASIYNNHGIDFSSLQHLDDIGLLSFDTLSGYVLQNVSKQQAINYYGTLITITFPKENENEFRIGKVMLSKIGQELAPICNPKPIPGFFEYILGQWANMGLVASSPYPRR